MAASFVGSELRASSGNLLTTSTLNVPVPAGYAEGDIIVATCSYGSGSAASTAGPSNMTGWTEQGAVAAEVVAAYTTVYTRTATASETSYDFTKILNGSDREASVQLTVLRGVSGTASRQPNANTGVVFPATGAGAGLAFRWWAYDVDRSTKFAGLTGLTFINEGGAGGFQESYYDIVTSGAALYDTGQTDVKGNASETLFFSELQTAPAITDINTDNTVVPGTTATVTGTKLTGTTAIDINGVAQSGIAVVSDTQVTFTVVRGGNPYKTDLTATLTTADGTDTHVVQQVAGTKEFAVEALNPNTTDAASLWTGLVDTATGNPITIVDGDQALMKDNVGTGLGNLSSTQEGVISADTEGDFVVQIRLASEGTWGADQTVTFAQATIAEVVAVVDSITGTVSDNMVTVIEGESLLAVDAVVITDTTTGTTVDQPIIEQTDTQITIIATQGDLTANTELTMELVVEGATNTTMPVEIWQDPNFNANQDRPLIPMTWVFGSRHPKTARRVRKFRGVL